MTTQEALLAAVLARPEDDLPRLVYADYLEENGEAERAGIIRDPDERWFEVGPNGLVFNEGPNLSSQTLVAWFRLFDGWGSDSWPEWMRVRVRRGFVAEVTCTLSQWCGGECPRCVFGIYTDDEPACVMCRGTGQLPGIGPSVVRSHPVEVVRVSDREPHPEFTGEAGIGWIRYGEDAEPRDRPDVIPADVYDMLLDGSKQWDYIRWMQYNSTEDAHAALSAALIAWAKSQPHPHAAENAELDDMLDDAMTSPSYD